MISNRNKIKKGIEHKTSVNINKPSLKVFRSNVFTYAIVVGVDKKVVKSFSTKNLKGNKTESAFKIGELAGEFIIKNKIENIFFNRSGYTYQGRVKAVAEGARKAGVNF